MDEYTSTSTRDKWKTWNNWMDLISGKLLLSGPKSFLQTNPSSFLFVTDWRQNIQYYYQFYR